MLSDDFKRKIEYWKSLPRNNAEELKFADDYFDRELMPARLQAFVDSQKVEKQYYGMFLTLGTSWQPMALSISAIKPHEIMVMCSENTLPQLEKLKEFLPEYANKIRYAFVSKSESDDIYQVMQEMYDTWHECGNVCVDITGGTKAMASSAGIMGAILGIDIFYVESRYIPLYRRPEPGNEELKKIEYPKL